MRISLFGSVAALAMASAYAGAPTFYISGVSSRNLARTPVVTEALNVIVGSPPADDEQWRGREGRQKWIMNALNKSSVNEQMDALLASVHTQSISPSAAKKLEQQIADAMTCPVPEAHDASYDSLTLEADCDNVFATCQQSCTHGLWMHPKPGACQLVCSMALARCTGCSYKRHMMAIWKIFKMMISSCAAVMAWIARRSWLPRPLDVGLFALMVAQYFVLDTRLTRVSQSIRDHNSRINSRSLTDEELYQKIWLALEILIYKDANIPQERASEVLVDDDAAKDRPALEAVKKDKATRPEGEQNQHQIQVNTRAVMPDLQISPPTAQDEGILNADIRQSSLSSPPPAPSSAPASSARVVVEQRAAQSRATRRPRRPFSSMSVYDYVSRSRNNDR